MGKKFEVILMYIEKTEEKEKHYFKLSRLTAAGIAQDSIRILVNSGVYDRIANQGDGRARVKFQRAAIKRDNGKGEDLDMTDWQI